MAVYKEISFYRTSTGVRVNTTSVGDGSIIMYMLSPSSPNNIIPITDSGSNNPTTITAPTGNIIFIDKSKKYFIGFTDDPRDRAEQYGYFSYYGMYRSGSTSYFGKVQAVTQFAAVVVNVDIDGMQWGIETTPPGLSTLHIDDTRLEQINYNGKTYNAFPVDIPLVPTAKTMTVIGKTFNVQLDNELNIERVKDGHTEYRQFPATIMVGADKALQLYGKADPEITIDYTGTQDPVISNTPVTPPPVV